jgi:hypothetical protein
MIPSESLAMQDKTIPRILPSEWCLVNLGKRKTTTLVGILDVGEVIVEVVVCSVSSSSLMKSWGWRSNCGR